jgi:ribonuclease BN (tRNA processing enzyme)
MWNPLQISGRRRARAVRLFAPQAGSLARGCALLVLGWALTAAAQADGLSLVVLGSGGPGATGRAASSYLVLVDGTPRILVDAGPGSFARLGESKLSLAAVDIVLLTHLHIDHAGELPGLFKARAVASGVPIRFQVFGPDGRKGGGEDAPFPSTTRFIDLLFGPAGAFAYLRSFAAPMTIQATDIATASGASTVPAPIYSERDLRVSAVAGHHGDAPAVIYRIEHAGKSITFSGDIDAHGLANLRRIAQGTTLLVFNTAVLDPPGSPAILYTLHTPPSSIGEVAATVRAGRLLLSHLTPAVEGARQAVVASIERRYKGPVTLAADGLRVEP